MEAELEKGLNEKMAQNIVLKKILDSVDPASQKHQPGKNITNKLKSNY
jgi:hypothetical protein